MSPGAGWYLRSSRPRGGTKITFKPDAQIFETTEYSFDTLANSIVR
jgi:DNA gyrase/topoisomerase IV subunit B